MAEKNDLNSKSAQPMLPQLTRKELADEHRQIDFLSTDGLSAMDSVPGVRRTLSWRLQTKKLFMLGPVSLHGFCSTDVSRKSARYRSLPASQSIQALSHGYSWPRLAEYVGQRQLGARLAYLRRFCTSANQPGQRAVPQRRFQPDIAGDNLRARHHHDRLVPVALSLGLLSQTQRRCQTAHAIRLARQYSDRNHHYSRPDSRRQHSRSANFRSRCFLLNGSRLSRFPTLTPPSFSFCFLR